MEQIEVFNKPTGFNSHRANDTCEGWLEYLCRRLQKKLWLCHRLDKETSGAILLAHSQSAAQIVHTLFADGKVVKKYLFITDRKITKENFSIDTKIEKQANRYISTQNNPNAKTSFVLKKTHGKYFLWEATPHTGKTHQIRIHAKTAGIPVLGDHLYGGSPCFRLMLHSCKIDLQGEIPSRHYAIPAPIYFDRLEILDDLFLSQLIYTIDRRITLYSEKGTFNTLPSTIRLIHTDHPWLHCDKLSDVLWFSGFHPQKQLQDIEPLLVKLKSFFPFEKFFLRLMPNRGRDPHQQLIKTSNNLPVEWPVFEGQFSCIVKTTSGTSSGIFLDQRQNRKWVYENAKDKKVLNLYSYTSLFSVCAALGGAIEVVSVDSSKTNLDWAKENFTSNQLDIKQYEFWLSDSEMFLEGCIRKKRAFDLIICDPPSFSRYKKKVFKIEKSFSNILYLCHQCLDANGIILFSSNFGKWKQEDFKRRVPPDLFKIAAPPIADYDFELPGNSTILKSLLLLKV